MSLLKRPFAGRHHAIRPKLEQWHFRHLGVLTVMLLVALVEAAVPAFPARDEAVPVFTGRVHVEQVGCGEHLPGGVERLPVARILRIGRLHRRRARITHSLQPRLLLCTAGLCDGRDAGLAREDSHALRADRDLALIDFQHIP